MKNAPGSIAWISGIIFFSVLFSLGCNEGKQSGIASENPATDSAGESLISHGAYLVTIAGCSDCHSPKKFTNMGPVVDSSRYLSGYPGTNKLLPVDGNVLKPGSWALMSGDGNAFAGPWGVSFAANLTPDSATGIGAWSEDVFINTVRTGKHLGQPSGRDILPPMPWYYYKYMTDKDLKSIYTYLMSIQAVSNKVPQPITPPELQKLASK